MAELENAKTVAAANAEARRAAANKAVISNAETTMMPGSDIAPDQSAAIKAAGGGGLILGTPMTAGVPSQFAEAPDAQTAASGEVPQTTKETYKGTPEQQLLQQHKEYAQKVVDALTQKANNGEELSPVEQEALFQGNSILMTGKSSTVPAGVVVPKGAGSETNTPEKKFYALVAKKDTKQPLTAEEESYVTRYEAQHPDEMKKAKVAADAANAAADRTDARTAATQLFQTKQALRTALNTADAKLAPDLERVERARQVLNSPNFLTDVLAAPEVLQIMAGGMGSGLRMTTAELNNVNQAQTLLNQLKGKLAKATGLGDQVTIQAEMRDQMKKIISTVDVAKTRLANLTADTYRGIDSAQSQQDLDNIHANYIENRNAAVKGEAPTKPYGTKARIGATNPQTGEKLYSDDGGKTWHK
jgi:hypothetical protein